MNIANTISRQLKIEPGEHLPVLLAFLLSFFSGHSHVLTGSTGSALFLEQFDADFLPYVYIGGSIAVPVFGLFLMGLRKRKTSRMVNMISHLFMVAFPLLFFCLFFFSSFKGVSSFTLLVWAEVELVAGTIIFWSIGGSIFTIRQAKRLFGIIGTGFVAAQISGGLLIPFLLKFMDVHYLLLLSGLFQLCALVTAVNIYRFIKSEELRPAGNTAGEQAIGPVITTKYFIFIFLMVTIGYFVYYFVDILFYGKMESSIPDRVSLASFFGTFWACIGIFNLLLRLLFYGPFTQFAGIKGALTLPPFVTMLTIAAAGIAIFFIPFSPLLFWLFVLMKFTERVFVNSVYVPAYFTLFQTLDAAKRDRIQNFSETVVGQGAAGLWGLVLLICKSYLALSPLHLILVAFAGVLLWIILALKVSSSYTRQLARSLKTRSINEKELSLDEPQVFEEVARGTSSTNPFTVIYCLELIFKHRPDQAPRYIRSAAASDSPLVRKSAFLIMCEGSLEGKLELLKECLKTEKEPEVLTALFEAIGSCRTKEAYQVLKPYLESEEMTVKQAVYTSVTRYFPGKKSRKVYKTLKTWITGTDTDRNRAAAIVYASSYDPGNLDVIKELLVNAGLEISRPVVENLHPDYIPGCMDQLITCLTMPDLTHLVIPLLARGDDTVMAFLNDVYDETGYMSIKKACIEVFRKKRSPAALDFLAGRIYEIEKSLLFEVLRALKMCNVDASMVGEETVEYLIIQELTYCSHVLRIISDINEDDTYLLSSGLFYEYTKTIVRICLILNLVYPGDILSRIIDGLTSGSEVKKSLAIELCDTLLETRHKSILIPLLEAPTLALKLDALNEHFKAEVFSTKERLSQIESGMLGFSPWIVHLAHCMDTRKKDDQLITKVLLLRKAPLFAEIPHQTLSSLAEAAQEVRFSKGEKIIVKGEMGTSMYIIAGGAVGVYDGEKEIARLTGGSFFGELAALDPEKRSASVIAENKALLYEISNDWLYRFVHQNLHVAEVIIKVLCHRIRNVIMKKADSLFYFSPSSGEKGKKQRNLSGRTLTPIEKIILLKQVPFLKTAKDTLLYDAAHRVRVEEIKKGRPVYKDGDESQSLYVVITGKIALTYKEHLLDTLEENQIFGTLSAFDQEKRESTAAAIEDSYVLEVGRNLIHDIMIDQFSVTRDTIIYLVRELRRVLQL